MKKLDPGKLVVLSMFGIGALVAWFVTSYVAALAWKAILGW